MSPIRLSNTEAKMLTVLVVHGERYGLEMLELEPSLKRGSIYVILSRLSEKGYVTSRTTKEEGQSGLPRRLFSVTGLGKRVLALSQSMDADAIGGLAYV